MFITDANCHAVGINKTKNLEKLPYVTALLVTLDIELG